MRCRSFIATVIGVALLAAAVAGCSDSEGSASGQPVSTTKAPAAGASTATIAQFEVPKSAVCEHQTFTTVQVSYATSGAAKAELRVDGKPIPLSDPKSGAVDVDVRCDPLPHDFVLFAYDAANRYTSQSHNLTVG